MSVNLVKHTGGCHCGKVRFEVIAKPELRAYDCKWVVEHSVFLTFLEINIQLRSTLNSTSHSQFLKGFCVQSSFPFPFFWQLFYLCQKGNETFPDSKGKFQACTGTKQIGIFPTNPRSAFSENQAQSPTRPRISKKYIFLLISRIIYNFIVSVKHTLK